MTGFVKKPVENAEKLTTPSTGDGNIVKLEVGEEITVYVADLFTEEKTTKVSKDNKPTTIAYLRITNEEGEEALMSGFTETVFGKQLLSYFGVKNAEGVYGLKPDLKGKKVRMARIARVSEKGQQYHELGVEVL